jgi:nucleoside-diphosphate-sugar epimerase
VDRLLSGKSPQWTVETDKPHSLTYTSDCGRALPLLVADPSAYNQVWHLPTAHPPITLRRFIELAAEAAGVKTKPSFDSSKFAEHSSLSPTPYERGIAETVEYHRKLKG